MATKPKKVRPSEEEQHGRFVSAARDHGCDEHGQEFEKDFRKLVPAKQKKKKR